uniref:Uncharacterized protein n=1 Tax=Phytophthora ramorum TaxID=164328 RepID=H3GZG7_PHYRM
MCACEKPTNELFNRISCAEQIDPVFYSVLQLTLSLGGAIATEERRTKSALVTTEELLNMLVANEQQRAVEELRLSSSSFPCFLYADRYFVNKEAEIVEIKLRERDRRGEVDLKRLAAVEHELLEEQKNFAVLVLQFEQAQKEKAQETAEKEQLQTHLKAKEQNQRQSNEEIKSLLSKTQEQAEQILALQASLDDERGKVEVLKLAKISDAEEKQGLLFEILKLKEEKRKLTSDKQEVEAECASIARRVGGEKEALGDLEGRLAQAIHRWEEEQLLRRKAERQVEAISRQLLQMEEERCNYSSVLQQSPAGKLAPKASLSYVLALKDKEVEELSCQLQDAFDCRASLQQDIARYKGDSSTVRAEKGALLAQQADMQKELLSLRSQIEEHEDVVAGLKKQLQNANTEIQALKSRILDFEEELDRQAQKKANEGASGYCKECEERVGPSSSRDLKQQQHRRHRSWDDSTIGGIGVRKNTKNIPIMKLVRVLSGRGDNRAEESDQQQLLEALKQLTALLKSEESLKDDLPECLVIKSVLTLMHQHKSSLVLQLECLAEGGVEPVLAAMKNFQSEAKMQEASCVLLTNLAHNCETNRKRILDAGGIDAVLQAMQTFPELYGVQKRCCWALLTLAGSGSTDHLFC